MKKKENNCKCQICGDEFYRTPNKIMKNVYCSMECRNKGMKKYNFQEEDLTELEYLLLNYEILKEGKVINKETHKEITFSKNNKGYLVSRLYTKLSKHKDGRKPYKLHRLVAMMFLEDYSNELQVNHKDMNKINNHIDNLEMMTNSQNCKHAWDSELGLERKEKLRQRYK